MQEIVDFFSLIREESDAKTWSKGVSISRSAKISSDQPDKNEVRLNIKIDGKGFSPIVSLWLKEEDWHCDCVSDIDPCEHVVAGTIALKTAKETGRRLPRLEETLGRIEYHFSRDHGSISFQRLCRQKGHTEQLAVSLTALANASCPGPNLSPSRFDMTIDHLLDGNRSGGVLAKTLLRQILPCLASCEYVFFEGDPILCSGKKTGPIIRVSDNGNGVTIKGLKNPCIVEVFKNGLVLSKPNKNTEDKFELRPLHDAHLSPARLKILADGQNFGRNELASLVSEVLPDLEHCFEIELLSKNLPRSTRMIPRIAWECLRNGSVLESAPVIVYGQPIQATVVGNELIQIGSKVPIRMLSEEQKLGYQLSQSFPEASLGRSKEYSSEEGVKFLQFLKKRDQELLGDGVKAFELYPKLKAEIVCHNDSMQIVFSCAGSNANESKHAVAQSVLSAWKNASPLVQLLDGGWAPIPHDFLEQHAHILAGILGESGFLAPEKANLPMISELCEDLDSPIPSLVKEWRKKLADFKQIPKALLPAGMKAKLRPYQLEAYHWLCFIRDLEMGALLADDMGLGKTLQAVAAIESPCLVVAPTSVTENWIKEIKRFRPNLRVSLYHGANRCLDKNDDVIVTSYALARLDAKTLNQGRWSTLIIDEAQMIKNPKSQAARALGEYHAKFKIALSGTPVENRLDDLWSLYHFLIPGLLGSFRQFQQTFGESVVAGDLLANQRLHRRIKPFFLRRTKAEVASDLPARTDIVRYCDLSEEERKTYEAIRLASRKELVERISHDGRVLQALEMLLRLRQASCHRGLLPSQEHLKDQGSSKLKLLLECLLQSKDNGHKSLVFSQWTSFLDLIEQECKDHGLKTLRIDGTSKNRQSTVDQFQTEDNEQILLLSLKAAGVGLNLTAAENVYICDPWWNPAVEEQAADRAHRIGQNKPVLVTRLVSRDTVEEKILKLQASKKVLAKAVVTQDITQAGLCREDLLQLLD